MRLRNRFQIVGICVAGLVLTGLAPLAAHADDPTIVLDDFSGYATDAALNTIWWRNTSGTTNSVALVPSPAGAEYGNAMAITYAMTNTGYSGRRDTISGYWPGLKAVDFWIQSDGLGHDILIQISDGAPYEFHLNSFAGFDPTSTAPQHLSVPIALFPGKDGATGTLNPSRVSEVAIYINKTASVGNVGGTIIVDEFQLVFDTLPEQPSVAFASSELANGSATNIVSLLNQTATLPTGGKISQVIYSSDNPSVLPDFGGRLVPKGDFLSNGVANIQLTQVQLFFNGGSFTLNVNIPLKVTVTDLAPAVDVVDYLNALTGNGILSGMHYDGSYATPANCDQLHRRVATDFGVYPAFYSADFLTGGTVQYRQNMINEIIRQWNAGDLVQIMFHVSPPQYTVAQEPQGNWGGDQAHETLPSPNRIYSFVYNDQWTELMTDGTALNTNWKLRMDEYARFLQQLENAGVTVMLRPFHEMNQHVFWWGGRPGLDGSAGLYRMFHDYMEQEKGLSNILWVWNIQDLPDDYGWFTNPDGSPGDAKFARYKDLPGGLSEYDANDWNIFNPGKDYYDILSVDFYDAEGYSQRRYDQAYEIAQADGKPMFIGEAFTFPTQAELSTQQNWTIHMPWGQRTWTLSNNPTLAEMPTFYANSVPAFGMPRFSTRDNTVSDLVVTRPAAGESVPAAVPFSGTGEPGASVTVDIGGTEFGPVTVPANGKWSIATTGMPKGAPVDVAITQSARGQVSTVTVLGVQINGQDGDLDVEIEIPEFPGGLAVSFTSSFVGLTNPALSSDKAFILGSGTLPTVVVEDSRPGPSVGWDATVTAGATLIGPDTVDGKALGIAPAVVSVADGQTVTAGAPVAAWDPGFKTGTSLGSSPAGSSRGIAGLGGTVSYKIPATVAPGSYSGVLSVTLL